MTRPSVTVLLAVLTGCGGSVAPPEGVYTMCRDVAGFSGETIELKNGKFRYWFYSDAGSPGGPYPITGTYRIAGNTLTLDDSSLSNPSRTIATVNGVPVLWRKDGLDLWQKEEQIHPYAVLIRVEGASGDQSRDRRPTLASLKSAKQQDREEKEYQERFNDQPPEVRGFLRARTHRVEPWASYKEQLAVYKEDIAKARACPDPKVVSPLVALMGRDSEISIKARGILEDLYTSEGLLKTPPPFLDKPEERKKALEALVEALSAAPDRNALEETLMLFLRVSGTNRIVLSIPDTPLQIRLELRAGGKSYDSQGTPADDINWIKFMPKVIPACQKWMREQLAK